jgi:hypothetical protein
MYALYVEALVAASALLAWRLVGYAIVHARLLVLLICRVFLQSSVRGRCQISAGIGLV